MAIPSKLSRLRQIYINFSDTGCNSYNDNLIQYEWPSKQSERIIMNKAIKMLAYKFSLNTTSDSMELFNDTFSTLIINLKLKRQVEDALISVYTSSTLIVFITWFSFWMHLDAIPGRVFLCVTSLLILVMQFASVRSELPPVSYVNGADVWMSMCMLHVFVSLLEFTFIKYISMRNEIEVLALRQTFEMEFPRSRKSSDCDSIIDNIEHFNECTMKRRHRFRTIPLKITEINEREHTERRNFSKTLLEIKNEKERNEKIEQIQDMNANNSRMVSKIDYYSRIMYPICFILFNIIYWSLLLNRLF
ncbi:glycine receptor subunit alpha-2-like protein [Leptotrombidium deliense]|uniref:Glycine receptor subunit alpha-2-like protein n=1 Tax=Leptotrombidium deliense TaxID=299467 RepID=A0A443SN76_9ACAR|nr:glycine receptor subunit alpha-2-like protein [Leptotrombidium deliense]